MTRIRIILRKTLNLNICSAVVLLCMTACGPHKPAPVHHFGAKTDSRSGATIVRKGDTVWRISERYRLPLRDIIDLNRLKPPYHLKTGQRLKLPPPSEYTVKTGDTVSRIARMLGASPSQLVRQNSIRNPSYLQKGQVLRVPSPIAVQRMRQREQALARKKTATRKVYRDNPPVKTASVPKRPARRSNGTAQRSTPVVASSSRKKYIWPVKGRVISSYGPKQDGLYNDGINIAAPRGTPVMAATDGVVVYVGDALESYGNLVLLRHAGGIVTAYAHMQSVIAREGDRVQKGEVIGRVGASGNVDSAQLHFEVRKGTKTRNPKKYLG